MKKSRLKERGRYFPDTVDAGWFSKSFIINLIQPDGKEGGRSKGQRSPAANPTKLWILVPFC